LLGELHSSMDFWRSSLYCLPFLALQPPRRELAGTAGLVRRSGDFSSVLCARGTASHVLGCDFRRRRSPAYGHMGSAVPLRPWGTFLMCLGPWGFPLGRWHRGQAHDAPTIAFSCTSETSTEPRRSFLPRRGCFAHPDRTRPYDPKAIRGWSSPYLP
jgi:hypothetical protein